MVTVVVSMNLYPQNQSCSQQRNSSNLIFACSSAIKSRKLNCEMRLLMKVNAHTDMVVRTNGQTCTYRHKSGKKSSFSLTLAEALLLCFPPEPSKFCSLCSRLNNLLFSPSSILFSSNNNLTYTRHCFIKLLPGKLVSSKKIVSMSLLTSSSALVRLILRCSLSC